MQRLSLLVCCTLIPLACDPQDDDTDPVELAEDEADDEPVLAGVVDEPASAPDADVSLGAEIPPQATITCTLYSKNTTLSGNGGGCSAGVAPGGGGGGTFIPDLEPIAIDVARELGVSDCAASGYRLASNGKPRCSNVCSSVGKVWSKPVDFGMCLGNEEYTASPIQVQESSPSCPAGMGQVTQTVQVDAQCGCTCSSP